jgi:ubiquitin carboxyl-terminal hydrolase 25
LLIAEHRNSQALKQWLDTGTLGDVEMEVGTAYARLDISDSTVDDELVSSAYKLAIQDTPSQKPELQKALTAIAKSRNSSLLRGILNGDGVNIDQAALSDWPVGLENIGNTCYLNSLLQFYFCIRPLRELVLDFDKHKVDLEKGLFARKQVGSRRVSKREVERAQRFVLELQKLFKAMIASNKSHVKPRQELAHLTLVSTSQEESYRRKSTLQGDRPSLEEIQGESVRGPQPAPVTEGIGERYADMNPGFSEMYSNGALLNEDENSEETLVDKNLPNMAKKDSITQADVFEDKENCAPSKQDVVTPHTPDKFTTPLSNTSPSKINERPESGNNENSKDSKTISTENPKPPSRPPPPVPPREKPIDKREILKKEMEVGAQQDVTEVISNVLFQLECAIKAESVDETGEQIDLIKRLFFGKQKVITTSKDGKARTKEEVFSDIKVQVTSGPRDIYEALEDVFDEQEVVVGTSKEPQYTSISLLPPILQIHIARAQFNKKLGSVFKSNHHLEFPPQLFMDRYLESEDKELHQRRTDSWEWKKELAKLEKRKLLLTETEVCLLALMFITTNILS